ncbi:Pycsar system effector family protein [Streptomyces sp. NPDC091383]|uniref:Pycsar system effector family protein n=1 Tax=Streptomyces sp. NPDC091383 TaxID=3365996 RepID=UPI00382167B8
MSAATGQSLMAAHAEVKSEISRTDGKTSLLLAFVGAVLAGAWSVGHGLHLTVSARVAGGAGMGLLLVATGLLLWSVRPHLSGRHGFPLWATLTPEQITDALSQDLAADIAGLSRLAVAKFRSLRRAVDLTLAGGALLVIAALLSFGGAA